MAAAPDVALSVALARCNTAAAAVAEGDSGALRAFQELEAAAQLLGTHSVAPALVAEIQGAIEVCLAIGPSNEVPGRDRALSSSYTFRYMYRDLRFHGRGVQWTLCRGSQSISDCIFGLRSSCHSLLKD